MVFGSYIAAVRLYVAELFLVGAYVPVGLLAGAVEQHRRVAAASLSGLFPVGGLAWEDPRTGIGARLDYRSLLGRVLHRTLSLSVEARRATLQRVRGLEYV